MSPIRHRILMSARRGSTECGLNGLECRPFQNNTFAFRCPATCETVRVLEPYIIGNTIINYQSLIVGGGGNATYPQIYRGDSFICPAAIHAGLFPARIGGSGIINLLGEYSNFTGTISNGLQGLDFHSTFPQSYAFDEINGTSSGCSDPRWIIMALTIVYTTIVSLCTMSASRFFSAVFISAYFCIALAADAPQSSSFYVVVSLAFRGFLPAAFIGFVIYRFVSKHTLDNLEAPLDKTILWLGPFWVGALDNMTFDLLPLQRLTPHDFMEPGAISVLVVVILVIAAAAIGQVWAYRIEGRLLTYLKFYLALGIVIVGLVFIPKLNLRLHHYIIALLLLPGTALQTRPSLVYQGLLVGLFINGIARWGFDSVLQTSGDLFATDLGSMLPQFQLPEITSSNITFTWPVLAAGYSGISVLVNDVERYRAFEDHISSNFTWTREREGEDVYFRFGFVKYGRIQDSSVGRYSDPGTWLANSSWILIDPEGR